MYLFTAYAEVLSEMVQAMSVRARIAFGVIGAVVLFWTLRIMVWFFSGAALLAVAGTVTFNGEPIPSGTIVFDPISSGQRRESVIKDGRYSLPKKSGLVRDSEYAVRVRAFRKTGRKYENADLAASFDEYEQYLPDVFYAEPSTKVIANRRSLARGYDLTLKSGSASERH